MCASIRFALRRGQNLEPAYQTLWRIAVNETASMEGYHAACQQLLKCQQDVAKQLLLRWGIPNAGVEAEDVTQEWIMLLLGGALRRCRPSEPIAPFAYKILRRLCTKLVRKASRRRICSLTDDVASSAMNWLDALAETELLLELRTAIAELPDRQHAAITAALRVRSPWRRKRGRVQSRSAENLLYRAKRRLKQILNPPSENTSESSQ